VELGGIIMDSKKIDEEMKKINTRTLNTRKELMAYCERITDIMIKDGLTPLDHVFVTHTMAVLSNAAIQNIVGMLHYKNNEAGEEKYPLDKCPFCGSKAEYTNPVRSKWVVKCSSEECPVSPHTRFCNTKEEAAKIWNRCQ
jgi:hypothetical protein